MVTIITGKINSGKSTTILNHYKKHQKGDGFISVKRMQYHQVHGYDLLKLSDKTTKPFVVREETLNNKIASCQIGPYVFLEETLHYVEEEVETMIKNNVSPIYLDEIGQLELYDKCFDLTFKRILENKIDAVITVRKDLIPDVLEKYNIKDASIISL